MTWKWFHACLTFFRGSYVQLTLKVKAQQDASESEGTSIWCFFFLNMSSLFNSNRESQNVVHYSHCRAHRGDVIVILGNITEIDLIWWVWKTSHFQDLFWFFFLLHVPTHPSSRRFAPKTQNVPKEHQMLSSLCLFKSIWDLGTDLQKQRWIYSHRQMEDKGSRLC